MAEAASAATATAARLSRTNIRRILDRFRPERAGLGCAFWRAAFLRCSKFSADRYVRVRHAGDLSARTGGPRIVTHSERTGHAHPRRARDLAGGRDGLCCIRLREVIDKA